MYTCRIIWGAFYILVFKVHSELFGAVSQNGMQLKNGTPQSKMGNLELSSVLLVVYVWVPLTLWCSMSVWGHSVHLFQNGM